MPVETGSGMEKVHGCDGGVSFLGRPHRLCGCVAVCLGEVVVVTLLLGRRQYCMCRIRQRLHVQCRSVKFETMRGPSSIIEDRPRSDGRLGSLGQRADGTEDQSSLWSLSEYPPGKSARVRSDRLRYKASCGTVS